VEEEVEVEEEEVEEEVQEEVQEEEVEEETDEDVEEFEINGKKYYLAPESKMVFAYIDDETRGDQVGKLMNGNVVPL
jgi:c-di-AMP phosphodiesterase-like protein